MKKSFIAITAASTILTGCASVKSHDDLLYSNQFSHTHSASHSDAMNVMMKAYNIEPKNPNNLDEFTGDYHSRLARRSNVTGGAFTAMSLLGGAGLGSSLLTGAIHSPTDQMATPVKRHAAIRFIPIQDHNELDDLKEQNKQFISEAVEVSLSKLGYSTKKYQYNIEQYMYGFSGRFNDSTVIFVRTDLERCDMIHDKLSDNSLTIMDTMVNQEIRELYFTCAMVISDSGSRLVNSLDVDSNESNLNYVWTNWFHLDVYSSWQVEVLNALNLGKDAYFYSPSFYWLESRNKWADVDVETMDRAIKHGVITPTPILKVLDGTDSELFFGLNDGA